MQVDSDQVRSRAPESPMRRRLGFSCLLSALSRIHLGSMDFRSWKKSESRPLSVGGFCFFISRF
jgi:hypothetical protein